jgi:hypothetical protein
MLGPVDYIVVGFNGNRFDGSALKEITSAVDKGIIRVIDLLFVIKDKDGNVVDGEYEDQSKEVQDMLTDIRYIANDGMPLMTEADIANIGEQMPNETGAGVLVLEHLWAKGLKKALMDAGGFLVADGRIHPEAIETAMKELETTAK